jgi:ribosome-associated toxin RatA of RatAB toxin-antitoxin module
MPVVGRAALLENRLMREVKRSALVAQSPARLFALISDVERYPQFVPGCTHARIESRAANELVATIGVRRGALRTEFTTRNEFEPDRRVTMHLVRGPFRVLEGEWLLSPIGDAGCRVELTMRFAFANPVTAVIFEPLFAETVGALMDAFVARARAPAP